MTYEEAIFVLVEEIDTLADCVPNGSEAIKEAVTAIRKLIPKKPNEGIDRTHGIPTKEAVCPVCDFSLPHWEFTGGGERVTYCEYCGQAISWEGWKWTD